MASETDDEPKRKKRKGTSVASWVLTGMLVLGLGGFSAGGFSNMITSVGSVGKTPISTDDYARELRQQISAIAQQWGMQMTTQEALTFGIDRQALATLVNRSALDETARNIGLSVGDTTVLNALVGQSQFTGSSGSFDREAYRFVLDRNGWSEQAYEESLRRDVSRSLLQGAISGGFAAPAVITDTLYAWIAERRGFAMIQLSASDLAAPIATPDDATLRAWYDANIADFTKPEAKRIAYAMLLPKMILADQPVEEAKVRAIYDENIAEYVVPERRLVDRLIYPDEASRDAALATLSNGKSFDDLVEDRGLTLDAIDMGDVSQTDLGSAGEAVFALPQGAVASGDTDLGPALFRVNGSLEGQNVSYESVRADLAAELQVDEARRVIANRVAEIDDLLAGGATLAELAEQMGLTLGTLDHVTGQSGTEEIAGYQAFRQAADALAKGDFAEAILLDDGGVVALEFQETIPAAPIPFEEARDAVAADWEADALKTALSARAEEMRAKAEAGASLLSLGIVDNTPEIARDGNVAGAPAGLLAAVFEMKEGELRVYSEGDYIALLQLNTITSAAAEGEATEALRQSLNAQLEQAFANDAFAAFSTAVADQAGVHLDQTALTTVNASLQ